MASIACIVDRFALTTGKRDSRSMESGHTRRNPAGARQNLDGLFETVGTLVASPDGPLCMHAKSSALPKTIRISCKLSSAFRSCKDSTSILTCAIYFPRYPIAHIFHITVKYSEADNGVAGSA